MLRTDQYSKIVDIPMGRYLVTARHVKSGKTLKLANNNRPDEFVTTLTVEFEPELNFCSRCLAIVYSDR